MPKKRIMFFWMMDARVCVFEYVYLQLDNKVYINIYIYISTHSNEKEERKMDLEEKRTLHFFHCEMKYEFNTYRFRCLHHLFRSNILTH